MKRLFLIAGMMSVLALAIVASSMAAANFAGTWVLDKAKSTGLSQGMMNAESVTWVITQDDAKIAIESKVVAGAAAPAGGGGGGGGRPPAGPRTFNLDGKEVTTEGGGQMGGTNTMKATWAGAALELNSVRTGSMNGQDFKSTSTDKLSLSSDGKVLTVARKVEGPRPSESTMVFNKQ